MNTHVNRIFCGLVLLFSCAACTSTGDKSVAEQRQDVQNMRSQVLKQLYQKQPDTKSQIENAAGYGVFSNANVNVIFASFGGGYGIIRNNKSGKDTYMNMGEAGLGLGLGAKDYRIVFVFHDAKTMQKFIDDGWVFGGQADGAAKASEQGGAAAAQGAIDNVTIYQLTEAGLVLQATVTGTKYWKNDKLN